MTLAELVRPTATDRPDPYSMNRRSLRGIAVACPAEALRVDDVARWVRRRGVTVSAFSSDQLALAVSASVRPGRIVMHGNRGAWGPIRCAVNIGVRQFVVNAAEQVAILEHCTRRQQVLVDVNAPCVDEIIEAAAESNRLDLVGLHCGLDAGSTGMFRYAIAVDAIVAKMSKVRARRGAVLCRLSLAGPLGVSPQVVDRIIDDATESSCARHHFPRPSVVFTPVLE